MSKESVSLPSVIDIQGIEEIIRIVGMATGIYLTRELLDGYERVNSNGKLAKRIKRNLKRELDVNLPDYTLTGIGNTVNKWSLKDDIYLVEYIDDLLSIVGQFSDDDSCFQEGHQNYHHLLAMNDKHSGIQAFCVYRSTGSNLGRAWCYNAEDGAKVYFNAYGLHLDKIAKLAGVLHKMPERTGYIRSDQNIWLNNGGSAYIVGGDKDTENYRMDLQDPDSYAPHRCDDCGRPIWDESNAIEFEDDGDYFTYCSPCYRRMFWTCERCDTRMSQNSDIMQRINGSSQYSIVCLSCAQEHYSRCDHCLRDGNDHQWFMPRRLTQIEDRNGESLDLCRDHHRAFTSCSDCGKTVEPGTAATVYTNRQTTRQYCMNCANKNSVLDTMHFCPECENLTIDMYNVRCRHCRNYDTYPFIMALIVQGDDEVEPAPEPASAEVVYSDTTALPTAWITMDDGTRFSIANIQPLNENGEPENDAQVVLEGCQCPDCQAMRAALENEIDF